MPYLEDDTLLIAHQPVRVFVRKSLDNIKGLPEDRKEDESWKGCYYTIQEDEQVYFSRSNRWDQSYFYLLHRHGGQPVQFKIWTGAPELWIEDNGFIVA